MRRGRAAARLRSALELQRRAREALTEAQQRVEEAADLLSGSRGEDKEAKLDAWVLYCGLGEVGARLDEQGQLLEDLVQRTGEVPHG
jgi:hypothetical protein